MRFDLDRLSRLAGIQGTSSSLNEGSNRAHHNGDVEQSETAHRYGGDNQLSEQDDDDDDDDKREAKVRRDFDGDGNVDEDIMLELDDEEIKKEVLKLRKARLNEDKLRRAIRHEIQDIFSQISDVKQSGSDSSWMYGDSPPTNSKQGQVIAPGRAFPGIGFKQR